MNATSTPTVSVIIPTYNGEKVLARAVSSVRAQGVPMEILVCDDGSKDRTVSLAQSLGCRVLPLAENSGGPNRGRNRGLAAAEGEWICLLDQDDEFLPGKLERQMEASRHAPIISVGYEVVDGMLKTVETRNAGTGETVVLSTDETFRACLRRAYNEVPYLSSLMLHRSLREVRFEEHIGKLDFDWLLRLFHGRNSVRIESPLVRRNVDGHNLSLNPVYRSNDFYGALQVLESYENEYPEAEIGMRKIFGTRARYFYLMGDMKKARQHFLLSGPSVKHALYYLTSFAGSKIVKRHFRVFG